MNKNKTTGTSGSSNRFVRALKKWTIPVVLVAVLIATMVSLFFALRDTVWCYFSDDVSIREDALTGRARMVLFEQPYQAIASFNTVATPHNATFTPDEASIVFTGLTGGKTNAAGVMIATHNDLYTSAWDGKEWQEPVSLASINTPSNEIGGVVSAGGYMYFVSDRAGGFGGYDIWVAGWNGKEWVGATNAGPAINTPFDEVDPAFDPSTKRFYFSSNRPLTADEVKARSSSFSTASADAGFDIFSAEVLEPEVVSTNAAGLTNAAAGLQAEAPVLADTKQKGKKQPVQQPKAKAKRAKGARNLEATLLTPTVHSVFSGVSRANVINSSADDRHVTFTPHGNFLYFASAREGGLGGFDIYRSRILKGNVHPPKNLGLEINSDADDISPSIRMEGFDIMFSSNRGLAEKNGHMLWTSTAREVVPRMDYSRVETLISTLLGLWWKILAAIAAAVVLWYLVRHYKDLTNLFHKCIMGSAIIHAALVLILLTWNIASTIVESDQGAPLKGGETSININALAREKLTVAIADETVKLPPSDVTVVAKQTDAYVPLPDFNPPAPSPLKTVIARSTAEAVLWENAPSAPREASTKPNVEKPVNVPKVDTLPPIDTPEVAAVMETRTSDTKAQPGKPTENFVPVLNVPGISVVKIEYAGTGSVGVATAPTIPGSHQLSKNASAVAGAQKSVDGGESGVPVPDTGGSIVRLSRGDDFSAGPIRLSGPGDIVSLRLASDGKDDVLRSTIPGELGVPEGFGTKVSPYMMRKGGRPSIEQVEGLGGSGATEGAVGRALDWFAKHQEEDGRWSIQKHGGEAGHDVAASGFALLCYLGWGIKYSEPGKYQAPAAKAVDWLMKQVKPDGDIRGTGGNMYDQGVASIALAEAYALTRDPALGTIVTNLVGFITRAQNPNTGGWRYQPGDPGDTSVFGWQAMALVSASMSGVTVPKESLDMAAKWLTSVSSGDRGGLYGYTDKSASRGMTAEAMFCRQILGNRPDDPKMSESAGYLRLQLPNAGSKDLYYWYYATLCMYQYGGPEWEDWNRSLKNVLPGLQVLEGEDAGAWLPQGIQLGDRMGKVVCTALATLSLEVYYRYLPFSFTKGLAPAQAAAQAAARTNAAAESQPKGKVPRKRTR